MRMPRRATSRRSRPSVHSSAALADAAGAGDKPARAHTSAAVFGLTELGM